MDKPEKADKPDRVEKVEKPDKVEKVEKDYTRIAIGKALAAHERRVGARVQFGPKHYVVVRIECSPYDPEKLEEASIYLKELPGE